MCWTESFLAWLREENIETVWLAYKLRVSTVSVHHWRHGSIPRIPKRKRIEALSKGRVPATLNSAAA